jgi:hypothetical protein
LTWSNPITTSSSPAPADRREIDKSFKDNDGYYVGVFVTSVS